jgi:hypothetical protein
MYILPSQAWLNMYRNKNSTSLLITFINLLSHHIPNLSEQNCGFNTIQNRKLSHWSIIAVSTNTFIMGLQHPKKSKATYLYMDSCSPSNLNNARTMTHLRSEVGTKNQ